MPVELRTLLNRIEFLRKNMEDLAIAKGSLTDPEVVAVSQKLDGLLNHYNKMMLTHNKLQRQVVA